MLDNEADIEAPGELNQTSLFSAAEYDTAEAIALLLERGADTEVKDCWDWTALHHSVHDGKIAALAIQLDKGANPETIDSRPYCVTARSRERRDQHTSNAFGARSQCRDSKLSGQHAAAEGGL